MAEEICEWEDEPEVPGNETKRDSILSSLECWDYFLELECLKGPQDLQLAAELGKTLLERNKELENSLKHCQNVIDDQAQEIEYLTKQTTALRKTNDNRIRIYEQLEAGIHDLERANQRLVLDNTSDKKQIKSLCSQRDALEVRCEELQKSLDEAKIHHSVQREWLKRLSSANERQDPVVEETPATIVTVATPQRVSETVLNSSGCPAAEDDLVVEQLMRQVQELKALRSRDQREMGDLKEEMHRRMQEMLILEGEVASLTQREKQVESLQEEILQLEEVRMGHLCGKCLKQVDSKLPEMLLDPEEDPVSDAEKYYNSIQPKVKEINPYRELVEKYEAVMEKDKSRRRSRDLTKSTSNNCLSLQEELKMYGDFNTFTKDPDEDEESEPEESRKPQPVRQQTMGKRKLLSTTPTDFSEAETSSSGFSDETSNKATQTESKPVSFLCSIVDGEECNITIYDNEFPIESRFRKTPEYRELFREIFAVLKRAAEAKDEGEHLPLLDDTTPSTEFPRVPPVTPAREDMPIDFEDLISLPDSVAMSETASEASSFAESALDQTLTADSNLEEAAGTSVKTDSRGTNDIIAYLAMKKDLKKSKKRQKKSGLRKVKVGEGPEGSESNSRPGSARRSRTRDGASYSPSPRSRTDRGSPVTPSSPAMTRPDRLLGVQPYLTSVVQEVAKLKKLDKTYAEVLRDTANRNFYRKSSANHRNK